MKTPQWLTDIAKQSDEELSALPKHAQPAWYRENITEMREQAEATDQSATVS